MEIRLQQMGDFYEKPNFGGGCKVGVENLCTKLPKGTPLRQIWSNKSCGVCDSDVVLTLESDERKKYTRIAIGNSMSFITLRRYRAGVITEIIINAVSYKTATQYRA